MSGSGRYCEGRECSTELPFATLAEAMEGRRNCPTCGRTHPVYDSEKEEALKRVDERLQTLTEGVVMLGQALEAMGNPHFYEGPRPTLNDWKKIVERLRP